ncbi:MAG: pilus assembly protein CpaD [Sphingosinicella sp.]|nr:pilus assembly protein CpaD [Sphingosinicella sp.]
MARTKPVAALLAVSALTVGCAELQPDVLARKNSSIYSVHQPVVQRTDYVLDVASTGNGIPSPEGERLRAWFESLQLGYGDRISIDPGSTYSDPAARADVARVAADYGLLLNDGAPITAGPIQPGAVRVIVSRMDASVPGCPDWSNARLSGGAVTTETNYGCATNSNLAAMIADPNDLVLGQAGASVSNSDTATKAIKTYREKAPTGAGGLQSAKPGG